MAMNADVERNAAFKNVKALSDVMVDYASNRELIDRPD